MRLAVSRRKGTSVNICKMLMNSGPEWACFLSRWGLPACEKPLDILVAWLNYLVE